MDENPPPTTRELEDTETVGSTAGGQEHRDWCDHIVSGHIVRGRGPGRHRPGDRRKESLNLILRSCLRIIQQWDDNPRSCLNRGGKIAPVENSEQIFFSFDIYKNEFTSLVKFSKYFQVQRVKNHVRRIPRHQVHPLPGCQARHQGEMGQGQGHPDQDLWLHHRQGLRLCHRVRQPALRYLCW